jgi:hypothetical protein
MNNRIQFVGVVKDRKFYVLAPKMEQGGPSRLTTISLVEAVAPEAKEIDLSKYEGKAIAVLGVGGGKWISSAEVVDEAGAIVAAIMAKVFGQESPLEPAKI